MVKCKTNKSRVEVEEVDENITHQAMKADLEQNIDNVKLF